MAAVVVNQDDAKIQSSGVAARQELAELRERMAVVKQKATSEEYRSLQDRVRDAKASLPVESDAATAT
jgi:hypothetical protein